MNTNEIVAQMTLEEKAALCAGADFWHSQGLARLGLAPAMLTDGPHGLRKQLESSDHLGINNSVPATCFPTASATACSFDTALMHEIGTALGEECLQEDVAVLLGPGANIKRSPLCGRNFEYISEDPYLTGEIASALIAGVQSKGVGVSMKHFAANNQEKARMVSDSIIDARALREIYLSGFETAVKKEQPWTLMCSYNKINGVYACENERLLTEILRDEWGFEGLVVTDWGAMDSRPDAIKAGLDLEMPGPSAANTQKIITAIGNGSLSAQALDACVTRIVALLLKAQETRTPGFSYDGDAHNALARRAAAESAVLLKNDGAVLPIDSAKCVALLGAFAKTPRYQGAGSSHINPLQTDCALTELLKKGVDAQYAAGYSLTEDTPDETLLAEAVALAQQCEIAIVFAGLPDAYESEGFDRTSLSMPESHNRLIAAVAKANPNTVVVLQCGSPIAMPWLDSVKAVLLTYLGGQACGGAAADLLLGDKNPSGKLAETFPLSLEDTPAHLHFAKNERTVEYRESIFVGYRWYDTAARPVLFPFGFGLSYTSFSYDKIVLSAATVGKFDGLTAEVTITNTGSRDGAEVVQLYLAKPDSAIYRAKKELKGFSKIFLKAGESKTVRFVLDCRSFAYYNRKLPGWAVESGTYQVLAGSSVASLPLCATITAEGDGAERLLADERNTAPVYFNLPTTGAFAVSNTDFTAIYEKPLPPKTRGANEPFTENSTVGEIRDTPVGQQVLQMMQQSAAQMGGGEIQKMLEAMMMDMPLRALSMLSGGAMGGEQLTAMLAALNA